jgi:hypothetical protein
MHCTVLLKPSSLRPAFPQNITEIQMHWLSPSNSPRRSKTGVNQLTALYGMHPVVYQYIGILLCLMEIKLNIWQLTAAYSQPYYINEPCRTVFSIISYILQLKWMLMNSLSCCTHLYLSTRCSGHMIPYNSIARSRFVRMEYIISAIPLLLLCCSFVVSW